MTETYDVAIVGAGFTGLTAAYALGKQGYKVCVLEADDAAGGLAGSFAFADGVRVEKFYHHWFNNDAYVPELVKELGMEKDLVLLPSRTGMYLNGRLWKLSSPMDLLRFTALSFADRLRLGLLVFLVRRVKDWRAIEHLSIREWLEPLCGKNVYRLVWEPLIASKFSVFGESVNAVWMWKKLVLRGSTRNEKGDEQLAYFKGGFGRLTDALVQAIEASGGKVLFGQHVGSAETEGDAIASLGTKSGARIKAKQFLFTPAFPIIADILEDKADKEWLQKLRRVRYIGNICLVLRLTQKLSDIYWLNVNDPGFPFVGIIEHTNLDKPENYGNAHIVFLSRYLPAEDPLWQADDQAYIDLALEHLKRMFPRMDRSWISDYKVSRAAYAQPITDRGYSAHIPPAETPFENALIATMAQIYPEDRGTNYAIRDGRAAAAHIARRLAKNPLESPFSHTS